MKNIFQRQFFSALIAVVSLFATGAAAEEKSAPWLELTLGRYWEFEDAKGKMRISIVAKEKIGELDAFRVEWSENGAAYQGELWAKAPDGEGILVLGRIMGSRTFLFDSPYLMLKEPLSPGQTWQANLSVAAARFSDTLECSIAAQDETIKTPMGEYEARKVILKGRALTYHRWYARGVGLVQEAAYRGSSLMNQKTLVKTGLVQDEKPPTQ